MSSAYTKKTNIEEAETENRLAELLKWLSSIPVDILIEKKNKRWLNNIFTNPVFNTLTEQGASLLLIEKKSKRILLTSVFNSCSTLEPCLSHIIGSALSPEEYSDREIESLISTTGFESISYGFSILGVSKACILIFLRNKTDTTGGYQNELFGLRLLMPHIYEAYFSYYIEQIKPDNPKKALSAREIEVLGWVADGKTNSEIAVICGISEFTVKNHLVKIFGKLNVVNRAQAIDIAKHLHYLD